MILETESLYVDLVEKNEIQDILEVYNSNIKFLQGHMGKKNVDAQWLEKEVETMKELDFYSCKVVAKKLDQIIGIIDFSLKEECYLTLLMIHKEYKNKGYGREIYSGFEKFIIFNKCNSIRIDVVTNYDKSVLDFWKLNGFKEIENIELNWTGVILPAVVMKKNL